MLRPRDFQAGIFTVKQCQAAVEIVTVLRRKVRHDIEKTVLVKKERARKRIAYLPRVNIVLVNELDEFAKLAVPDGGTFIPGA